MPQWVKFKLLKRPYYDQDGKLLGKLTGRRNRPGIDEIRGGGMVYPDLSGCKIAAWHERYRTLCVLFADGKEADDACAATGKGSFEIRPGKKVWYPFTAHHAEKLEPGPALDCLVTECGLPEGTTLHPDTLEPVIPVQEE